MSHSTRRTFLQASALSAIAATRAWGANDKINVGIVGIGGRGTNHIEYYAKQPDARIAAGGLGRNNQFVIKSALAGAALAIGLEAIAMRIGGGRRHRSERAGDKGEQDGDNDEALHVAFLGVDAGDWQLPADRRLMTRIVAANGEAGRPGPHHQNR